MTGLSDSMLDARWSNGSGVAWWIDKECYEHDNCVLMVMVGDDHRWHQDLSDFKRIDDDEYCSGCGQIGCGHG